VGIGGAWPTTLETIPTRHTIPRVTFLINDIRLIIKLLVFSSIALMLISFKNHAVSKSPEDAESVWSFEGFILLFGHFC
jgi:hypothetical protein